MYSPLEKYVYSSQKFKKEYENLFKNQQVEKLDSIDNINVNLINLENEFDTYVNNRNIRNNKKELENRINEVGDRKVVLSKNMGEKNELEKQNDKKEKLNENNEERRRPLDLFNKLKEPLIKGAQGFDQLSNTLSGSVSLKDMSDAAKQIDNGFDQAVKDMSNIITGDSSTKYLEIFAKAKFGDKLYDTCSEIKNGTSEAILGIEELMNLDDVFGGSWRDPKIAAKKIESGIKTIQDAIGKINNLTNGIFKSITGRDSVILNKLDISQNKGLSVLGLFAASTVSGIGSIEEFAKGNISSGLNNLASCTTGLRDISSTLNFINPDNNLKNTKLESKNKIQEMHNPENKSIDNNLNSGLNYNTNKDFENVNCTNYKHVKEINLINNTDKDVDSSADMIYEISVVLEGSSSTKNSHFTINGKSYKLNDYSLSQNLLEPMFLKFSIEKEDKTETLSDVIFADSTQIIGKSLEIYISTIKTGIDSSDIKPKKSFIFKGMVIDAFASRNIASSQSASIIAASWDSLLQNSPNCRSFENMTLKEIILSILKPFKEIKYKVSPQFTEKIPYIVQYNQSDYSFLKMLAIRFGEWFYNTGEYLIFGNLDNSDYLDVKLEYPGGSLLSYGLQQQLDQFAFNKILPDYYNFGKARSFIKKSAKNLADEEVNEWTEKAYKASLKRYKNEQIQSFCSGGFDNGINEGVENIFEESLKIEAQGKKSKLMTVQGVSKLALLKIGRVFLIKDSCQNKSGENKDIEQKALKIIGINHNFDYLQEYSNSFISIPIACKYPPYTDPNFFCFSPSQRAKVVDNKDEQKLGRVRVQFPWQEVHGKEMLTPWLRIAVPYAGNTKGLHFIPEIGDEVIVGFEMDNAERPYVIGSLYNGGNGKPNEEWAVKDVVNGTTNNVKIIRTRNGHTIKFNDRGDAGLLEISDEKNKTYKITLSADERKITIYSAGKIEVKAKSNINIKSEENISIEANKEISIQASSVKVR